MVSEPSAGGPSIGRPSSGRPSSGRPSIGKPSIGKPRRIRGQRTAAHLDKLAEIKNEAARCFYAHGYAATDVRTIADRVGLQVSTLYNYMSGKEELLYLIMRDGMIEIAASLEAAIAGLSDPCERLRAAVRSHVLHHAHRQFLAWVGHVELRSLTGDYLEEIMARRREYERRWIDILEDGIRAGLFRAADPRLAMYGMLALGQGVSRWYRPDGQYDAEKIADAMADLVLDGMLITA